MQGRTTSDVTAGCSGINISERRDWRVV